MVGGPLALPEVVRGPSSRAGSGLGPSGRVGSGGGHSGRVGSGREALQQGRKWVGVPPAMPEVVGRSFGRA